jgi:murein DD-endopeptidase MepM/ murein hydrolase activator NlpD
MAKSKYRFNPESLSYDRIDLTFWDKLLRFLTYFSASLALAIIYLFVFSLFLDLPKEKVLKRELSQMILQYEILNKQLDQISVVMADIQNRDDNIYRTVFNSEPIPASIRTAGFGGVNRYTELEGYDNSQIVIETARRIDVLKKQLYVQSKSFDDVIELAKNKESMLASIPSIQPIAINDVRRIGGYYGMRIHPILKIFRMHDGMDFTAPIGTDVYATGDGVVSDIQLSRARRGYGNLIEIDHGYGYKTIYAHLEEIKVRPGQKIKRGDVIGAVGNTGLSTAPHLHYEIRKGNRSVNPINYFFNDLTPEEFDAMIELSQQGGSFLGM